MVDLEQQIRAWTDAAAAEGDPSPVTAEEVLAGGASGIAAPTSRRGGRWLAVAAVVAALAAIGVGVAWVASGGGGADRAEVAVTDSVPGTVDPMAGPVAFEVLSVSEAGRVPDLGGIEVAQTKGDLAQLWADTGLAAPSPGFDPEQQVVVAVTIGDDACPPTLERFIRDGSTIEPVFVEDEEICIEPFFGRTYVVAIDWASVGDSFTFRLPAQDWVPLPANQRDIVRSVDPEVAMTWELDDTEVAAGESVSGTVTVDNRSGAPLEGTTCGAFFTVRLRGPDAEVQIARPLCARSFTVPEGRSTYEVEGVTSYGGCSGIPDASGALPTCGPGGSIPPLPAGTYEALLDSATPGLVPPPDPIEVTLR